MPFEIPGVPAAYDRSAARAHTSAVLHREGADFYTQGAEHNEAQSIQRARTKRIGDAVMKDGDRRSGADVIVDAEAGEVRCLAGQVYVRGDILAVPERLLADVPMVGEVVIGVRLLTSIVTELDDPSLLGLHPGTAGEGEPGAAREEQVLAWGFSGDGEPGELTSVYRLLDGAVLAQQPPSALTGVIERIADYDWDLNGHYVVDGCEVSALALVAGARQFSIAAGTANIRGYKRIREAALSLSEVENASLETVVGEAHSFTGPTGGSTTIAVNRPPIAQLTLAMVPKRITQQVVRGNVPGGTDPLQMAGVYRIELVKQGATTFAVNTYGLVGGGVSWAPAGAEPAGNSTYEVTYLYNDPVQAQYDTTSVTVTGGVQGEPVTLGYQSKLPRIDLVCLDINGRPVYVKGQSARRGAMAPIAPASLLKLAEVHNTWLGAPRVENNGTRNITQDELRRYVRLFMTGIEQFNRFMLTNEVRLSGTPTSRGGIFTDTFIDDFYRDQGEAQTAAVNKGVLQLAVDPVLMEVIQGDVIMLPWVEEVVVSQPLRTSAVKINPYDNFTPFPAGMRIVPAAMFWTDAETEWTSPITQEFTAAPDVPPGQQVLDVEVGTRQEALRFLKQDQIAVTLEGFGVGEELATLTFDGRDVKPAGVQAADANGEIALTFTIPAQVPTGRRLVRAEGYADSFAEAIFVGQGTIDVTTMRRVTLVTRAAPVPVVVPNNIVQQTLANLNQLANPIVSSDGGGWDGSSNSGWDPQAQSYRLPVSGFVAGINLWVAAVGDPSNGVRVQIVSMANGYPTTEVIAEAFVSMVNVVAGQKIEARFDAPVFHDAMRMYAFSVLTADGNHEIAIARLGDVVGTGDDQERVSSQPYTIGDRFSASNRLSWQVHPDSDIAFEIVGATFTGTNRVVNLWTGDLDEVSDLLVRGGVEIPTEDAGFRYEVVRANGTIIPLVPGQAHEFAEYVSEQVTLRAVLDGTDRISPVLYPSK